MLYNDQLHSYSCVSTWILRLQEPHSWLTDKHLRFHTTNLLRMKESDFIVICGIDMLLGASVARAFLKLSEIKPFTKMVMEDSKLCMMTTSMLIAGLYIEDLGKYIRKKSDGSWEILASDSD